MNTVGLVAGIVAAAIWGGMYVVSKVVLEVIPPFALLSLRLLLGALVLGAVGLWRRQLRLTRPQLLRVLLVGVLGYGISLGFQFAGTRLSTASNGAVITSSTPAFVFLFAFWLLGERISRRRLAALLLATLGVLAVVDLRAARLSPELFLGNLFLVGAALTWALYSVLVRQTTRQFGVGVLPFSFYALLGGLFIALPAAALELSAQGAGALTPGIWAGVLYLGVVSTALAMYLWNKSFELLDAGLAALTFFAQPLVGASLGVAFLGESLTPAFLIGALLIGLGLWWAARAPRPVPALE